MKPLLVLFSIPLLGCQPDLDVLDGDTEGTHESALALESVVNPNGRAATLSRTGNIDRTNAFFRQRGNGRNCETCHATTAGWGVTAEHAQSRFVLSEPDGTGPLFKPHDESNNPALPHGTVEEKRMRYQLLLQRGLTRFDIPSANGAVSEFTVTDVVDWFGYSTPSVFAMYRRANTVANEAFATTVGFHGVPPDMLAADPQRELLLAASTIASQTHFPSITTTQADLDAMVVFMRDIVHAQTIISTPTGEIRTDDLGALGGVDHLVTLADTFVPGANDPASANFDPNVFQLFGAWAGNSNPTRAAIARGEVLFNQKTFGNGMTCSRCHATPNVGNHPVFKVSDIGTADEFHPGAGPLPILTVRNRDTGEIRRVTDLGHALVTQRWEDIGKFAIPKLRGLSSRAPYFHDGSARDLNAVLDHYKWRFGITFSGTEKADLVAFLGAL